MTGRPRPRGVGGRLLAGAGLVCVVAACFATCHTIDGGSERTDAAAEVAAASATSSDAETSRRPRAGAPDDAAAADGAPAGGEPPEVTRLRVRVVHADGTPAADARVALLVGPESSVSRILPIREVASGRTDAAGVVTFPTPETAVVVRAWTETESGLADDPAFWGNPGDERLVRLAPAPPIEVRVVDGGGTAVRDASVSLVVSAGSGSLQLGRDGRILRIGAPLATVTASTDASGRCRVGPLSDDVTFPPEQPRLVGDDPRLTLVVEAPGWLTFSGDVPKDGVLRLSPCVDVTADVVDPDGRPIGMVTWAVSDTRISGWGDEEGRVVASAPRGGAGPARLVLDAAGFAARSFDIPTSGAPQSLGRVVLERVPMLAGRIENEDGSPATRVMVGAEAEDGSGWHHEWYSGAQGEFGIEPPGDGLYRVRAWREGGRLPGLGRPTLFEATATGVRPGSALRLVLRHVPSILLRFTGPEPGPPGFSFDNVEAVAHSSDGRSQSDFLPEGDGRSQVVRLYGRGPWSLVVKHHLLETVTIPIDDLRIGPRDPVPVREVELRPAQDR